MGKLNKFTAFMGNKFQPVFGKIVYRNMRRKPIVPKELKRLSDLAPLDKDKVQLVAHRGLSGAYPENTAPSFEAAGKHGGYFGLECDTHMTRDGVWVIMHDPDVSTIYSGTGDVKELSFDEIERMHVARGSNADKFPGLKACTLQEYIDICKKYNCHPIIEIKDPRKDKMQDFYNVLLKNDLLKDAVIISFILDDLKELHDIDPTLNMWYLVNYLDNKNIKDARDAGCSGMDFSAEFNACRPEWIRKVHDNGLKPACWTVDNREMLASMIDAGVEYITTNSILPE